MGGKDIHLMFFFLFDLAYQIPIKYRDTCSPVPPYLAFKRSHLYSLQQEISPLDGAGFVISFAVFPPGQVYMQMDLSSGHFI